MFHRVIDNTDWLSRLSPIYYYNESKPLIPSYGASVSGLLVLAGLAVILSGAGLWLFTRRDVGDVVRLPWNLRLSRPAPASKALPVGDWSLGSVYARSLGMIAVPAFWWTLGFAAFAAWMIVAVHQIAGRIDALLSSATNSTAVTILQNIGGGHGTEFNALILGAMFELLPVLLMAFAVTQVNRWSADEDEGRLELLLAAPQSRAIVMLGRFAALATATVIVGVVTLAAAAVSAQVGGVALDSANLAEATLGMIPLGLLIAAIGYLASGWLRTAAYTGLISFVLAAWFFISFVGPDLKWPDATLRLSAFYYYGTPLLRGLEFGNIALVVVVGAAALAAATYRFTRKDVLPA
jgi:ABC-2 type transport system permease protein